MNKLILFLSVLLVGCTKPNYITGADEALARGESKATTACSARFQKSNLCVWIQWEKRPTETEVGAFLFKVGRPNLADASPMPSDLPTTPAVVLWMPGMGHGSSPVKVERIDVGTYRASAVFFIMPGEWEIKFQFSDSSSGQDEAISPFTF